MLRLSPPSHTPDTFELLCPPVRSPGPSSAVRFMATYVFLDKKQVHIYLKRVIIYCDLKADIEKELFWDLVFNSYAITVKPSAMMLKTL